QNDQRRLHVDLPIPIVRLIPWRGRSRDRPGGSFLLAYVVDSDDGEAADGGARCQLQRAAERGAVSARRPACPTVNSIQEGAARGRHARVRPAGRRVSTISRTILQTLRPIAARPPNEHYHPAR